MDKGARVLDGRVFYHFGYICVSPAMSSKSPGKGSDYSMGMVDSQGRPLDGSKTYKVDLPKDIPAARFWSFTVYDNQTRSMLQTDERFPGIDNNKPGMIQNAGSSIWMRWAPAATAAASWQSPRWRIEVPCECATQSLL